MIVGSVGNLYGTTLWGGADGLGVVFELSPVGGSWVETILHSFAGGTDGASPVNGLIMDPAGNLYGTTAGGGGYDAGTVFELSLSGGDWMEQVIYAADTNHAGLPAGLTMDAAGNIFGAGYSTVFELSPNGDGGWNPNIIHTFASCPKNGSCPKGTPVLDKAGNLYGTTSSVVAKNSKSHGTVYKLRLGKKGKWTLKTLYSFKSSEQGNGADPWAGVALDAAGNIYGTTVSGGQYGQYGGGTVFELMAPVGKGSYQEKVLWSFNGTDGDQPQGSLILDNAGNLYGTTALGGPGAVGGSSGYGVVFEVTP